MMRADVERFEITPLRAASVGLALSAVAIGGAWLFQLAGYAPCELCLEERWPYYIGTPFAALVVWLCAQGPAAARKPALALLGLLFLGSAGFGVYHAGVEWGFWTGPTACTGPLTSAASTADFLRQLHTVKVVRCDAVAIRILGLSLAGWNAVVSAAIVTAAVLGVRSARA
jgi:disulfide bond formation protein DsbB